MRSTFPSSSRRALERAGPCSLLWVVKHRRANGGVCEQSRGPRWLGVAVPSWRALRARARDTAFHRASIRRALLHVAAVQRPSMGSELVRAALGARQRQRAPPGARRRPARSGRPKHPGAISVLCMTWVNLRRMHWVEMDRCDGCGNVLRQSPVAVSFDASRCSCSSVSANWRRRVAS